MTNLDLKLLKAHRERSFYLQPSKRLSSPAQALKFVNTRGFVYFWPIKGIDLPSLWTAVAGNRPVADEHDDPGHITWGWKDNALGKKVWYYAKILRRKATLISLEIAPYFYALSENYGSPEIDYLLAYEEGRLTKAAKLVYEALIKEGALNTIDLRRAAMLSNAMESEFNRAMEYLQADFKILPVGVAQAGAWHYSFIYDMVTRHYPDIEEKARKISESDSWTKLAELYFQSVGAAQIRDLTKVFGWPHEIVERTISRLVKNGILIEQVTRRDKSGEWFVLSGLVKSTEEKYKRASTKSAKISDLANSR